MPVSIYFISILVFIVFGLFAFLILRTLVSRKTGVGERLMELKSADASGHSGSVSKKTESGWSQKVGAVSTVLPMSARTQSYYGRLLMQSGYRSPGAVGIFFGIKIILSVGLFVIVTIGLYPVIGMKLALIGGIGGFIIGLLAPNIYLRSKLRKRQTAIFHSLPDVLDLMTVCVEAGLGLDAAIMKIIQENLFSNNLLASEFKIVSQETRAGKPRADALRDMGERTGVEDIKTLAALLIQTDRLGASLSRSLRVHSDTLRTKRRQMAEEEAAKTTIKLIFPLATCIFPAMFVVLLGPASISIYSAIFGHVVK